MKIALVEDSPLVADSLKRLLADFPTAEIIGHAVSENEAITLIEQSKPGLVIMDLKLSPGSGLNVLKTMRKAQNPAKVIILTNSSLEVYRQACMDAGADAFFDKSLAGAEFLEKITSCLNTSFKNEQQRLTALHKLNILDTPPEEAFDRITRLLGLVLKMPIALISLVDQDRQWFKSRHGLVAHETPREIAFCDHTIRQTELMQVEDALQDPRFANNPLVLGDPNIRFYAGVPLIMREGEAIGTLCVIDRIPRHLDETECEILKVLAKEVVTELELRKRLSELEEEVVKRQSAEMEAMYLATRDPLTALPNRVVVMDRLRQCIKTAARERNSFAFIFINLDRFKLINDTMGHNTGDAVLQQLAERLTGSLREVDTVSRFDGNEFVVLLPKIEKDDDVIHLAEKLMAEVNRSFYIGNQNIRLDCNIGIAIYPDHGESEETLIAHANLAMYQAKQQGLNQYCLYRTEMNRHAYERVTLQADLGQGLKHNEFILHYQPQLMLNPQQIAGVEALLRWNHPKFGIVSPLKFIPLAEENGMIWQLGQFVIEEALRQFAQWKKQGLNIPLVAVNVSAVQLRSELVDVIRGALIANDLPASVLEIELTETALTSDGPQVHELLEEIRNLGVSIAVDDFGTGYSSLSLLRHLPINKLKIDRSFVHELVHNQQDATIVKSLIDMSQGLGLSVIAEGVETQEQSDKLGQLGCRQVQGYLYKQPVSPVDLVEWQKNYFESHGM